ncbi:FAD-binding oxidoreductase [Saccharopolyspora rosea]|uniref:FAD-binding oxidoreductase n=1 Tax=Saccharopolyspora rosea TaxID=524884 RepID=UPI0021D99312|nr:FAD-binding oxidoreductase [Saccharopolyspora rosea]
MAEHDGNARTAAEPESARWDALSRALRGDLVRPADSGYDRARRTFYSQFDSIAPRAVAFCETAEDIAACLAFCQDHDLHAAPRSGGHSMAGYSSTDGLVIDTSRLARAEVSPDPGTGDPRLLIGPGSRQVDTLTKAWEHGLTAPQGGFPTVCAGGFLTGGGFGLDTRLHGMACDQLTGAEVVLADGSVVRCSESEEPDLFWALRGGGGGNFGVITEFEVRPSRLREVTTFMLTWPWDRAADVIAAWQRWIIDGPDHLGGALAVVLPDAAPGAVPVVAVSGGWFADPAALDRELAALVAAVGAEPESRTADTASYLDAMLQGYGCAEKTPEQRQWVGHNPDAEIVRQLHFIDRSRLFGQAIPDWGVAELLTAFDADRRAGQNRVLSLFALGGQANRPARTDTAYVHRDTEFYLGFSVETAAPVPDEDAIRAAESWVDRGFAAADPHSNGESYQNFIDARLSNWEQAYYAENYPRLSAVKRKYDPTGFFRFAQGIR